MGEFLLLVILAILGFFACTFLFSFLPQMRQIQKHQEEIWLITYLLRAGGPELFAPKVENWPTDRSVRAKFRFNSGAIIESENLSDLVGAEIWLKEGSDLSALKCDGELDIVSELKDRNGSRWKIVASTKFSYYFATNYDESNLRSYSLILMAYRNDKQVLSAEVVDFNFEGKIEERLIKLWVKEADRGASLKVRQDFDDWRSEIRKDYNSHLRAISDLNDKIKQTTSEHENKRFENLKKM